MKGYIEQWKTIVAAQPEIVEVVTWALRLYKGLYGILLGREAQS